MNISEVVDSSGFAYFVKVRFTNCATGPIFTHKCDRSDKNDERVQ